MACCANLFPTCAVQNLNRCADIFGNIRQINRLRAEDAQCRDRWGEATPDPADVEAPHRQCRFQAYRQFVLWQ